MLPAERYYRLSGRFGPVGIITMTVIAGAAALVLGFVYGLISLYNPFVYVNFLLTCGLGFAVGFCVSRGGRKGKVRSAGLTGLWGVLIGMVAVYANWVGWLLARSWWDLQVLRPSHLLHVVGEVAERGAWSIGGWTPTGAVLYLLWLAEAGIIVVVSGYVAHRTTADAPFCETCEQWARSATLSPYEMSGRADDIVQRLEQGEYEALAGFAKAPAGTNPHVEFDLVSCPSCEGFRLLTIRLVTEVVKSKKQTERTQREIVKNLIVDARAHQLVLTLPSAPPAAAAGTGTDEAARALGDMADRGEQT